jgi:predicted ester cyclase
MADVSVAERDTKVVHPQGKGVEQQNLATTRQIFANVCNSKDIDTAHQAIDTYFSKDFRVNRTPPGITPTIEGTKRWKIKVIEGFPDYHTQIEDEFADGDRVVIRWRSSGTHLGEFQGIAPTGRKITVTGITISRYADGQIAESWVGFDTQDLMRQLGVVVDQDILCSKHTPDLGGA